MNYTSFLLKKIYKNKLNIIPFILFMGFIIFMYGNDRTGNYTELINQRMNDEGSIKVMEAKISQYENIVNNDNSPEDDRELAVKLLELENKELVNTKKRLDAVSEEDWTEYYKSDMAIAEAVLERFQITSEFPIEFTEIRTKIFSTLIKFDQHMLEYGNGFDNHFSGIQGITYIMTIYKFFIALFISVIMIFITSKVYCSTHFDKMDIQNLLPTSPFKRQCSKLYAGLSVGLGTIILFSILGFLCGTIGNTSGNLHSPTLMYNLEGYDAFIPFIEILPQLFILMVLAVLFITNVILCISLMFRKSLTCMLVSLVIIFGGLFVLPQLAPMGEYLHLIPTTYINFFNALTGEVAYNVQNAGVNFTNGVFVFIISNAVLMAVYYIVTRNRIKKV